MAFSLNSMAFYGLAIVGVVLLFRGVATHGEAHLKAPPKIDGTFKIETMAASSCLKPEMLLVVEQSGIYLSGALLPANANPQALTIAQEHPSLKGRWQNQEMSLVGSVEKISGCEKLSSVQIRGTFSGAILKAQWISQESTTPIPFQAQRQLEASNNPESGH